MKLIPLTQGQVSIVDDDAPAWIFKVNWYAAKRTTGGFYAQRLIPRLGGGRTTQQLHAVIAGTPPGMETLHINGDTLDNRNENVRPGTPTENGRGFRKRMCTNTTGRRGVYWDKSRKKFGAAIRHAGCKIHVGNFDDVDKAARARDAKARELGWPEEGMNFPRVP